MKRRALLQLLGGIGASSLFSLDSCLGASSGVASPPMNRGLLSHRNQNRSTVISQHGMVCAAVPSASMAGIEVLKAGGSAIDAAIAANVMLSLVEPMSCGPGGDLFAILWSEKDQKLFGLNATGRSPYDHIVVFDGPRSLIGQIVPVEISEASAFTLFGRVQEPVRSEE